ncbi:MAG: TM0106 family RecB-like putative nuclease [Thermoanaerobaculia bacterium]
MRFTATDTYDYHRPSKCGLRVYLRHHDVEEAPPGPFVDVLRRLGERHEKGHLATLSGVVDLSGLPQEERERRTLEEIRAGAPALYQPRFRAAIELDGEDCELVGEPDFLLRHDGGYLIRDSKLSRQITREKHPEIVLQLQLYGWLYERAAGEPPRGLEVHAGTGDIVPVPYDREAGPEHLRLLLHLRSLDAEPYEPVGWSKCAACGFHDRCWDRAVASDDVSLLPAVSQKFAHKLRERGVTRIADLAPALENPAFRQLFYKVFKKKEPKLLDVAVKIRRDAEVRATGRPAWIAPPALPDVRNFAVLDLEGMPPILDELEKIYLWGMKVFGDRPSGYLYAEAGFGAGGDRQGWQDFLRLASRLLDEHPDLRFVHFGTYERTKLRTYLKRHKDADGTAARILNRLVDLHSILTASVVLPVPSYGLKVVEKHVGFKRKLDEYRGDVAMARYIEATETSDPAARAGILDESRAYNEEDLDATWAVLSWLRAGSPSPSGRGLG